MVLPRYSSRVFYALVVQYREKNSISMVNISVGSEYFPILRDHCISKVQRKVSDSVDEHHSPGVIDGCVVAGKF